MKSSRLQTKFLNHFALFIFAFIFFNAEIVSAISGKTTYQARIVKPDGYPLESANVNFRFSVLDPAASCVMYVEDYAAVNMISSGGLISFALGTGAVSFPASATATTFSTMFDNSVTSFSCQSPGIYNPVATDNRKIVMQFNDGSGWQTLPAMAINAVPHAMYAAKSQNSQKLNNKADTAFVEYSTLASLNCQSNEAIKFNGVSFGCIAAGVSSTGVTSVTTSGTVLSTGGTASAPVISITAATLSSDGYLTSLDYAEFKSKLAASSTQIINTLGYAPVSAAAVTNQITSANLSGDVSGTLSSNTVQTVGGKTASEIAASVNETQTATASATVDTLVKRNALGNATFNDVYASAAKINYADIYKPSTNFSIRLQAPTSLSANYTLTLPNTAGVSGQVIATDGSGNLSWINAATGSVTSVNVSAPLLSTGGATPTISITPATSSTDGYLSSADWNTFNNKQQATSAAIIATLGYTPATSTTLAASFVQKAGDTMTGTLNLPSNGLTVGANQFVVSGSNIGVGTTTPVTKLDVSGGVRIGIEISGCSAGLAGTIRYNAGNIEFCNGTTWAAFGVSGTGLQSLNGSTSGTQTFAIGTAGTAPAFNTSNGVHTLNIPLASAGSVAGGLLSNADYTTFMNKITSNATAISQVLGYVPASATALGNYLVKANNLSDVTSSATARTNLGVGYIGTLSSVDLGSTDVSGTLAIARTPSYVGDVTKATASDTLVLSNSGVTAGTYTKVTVDTKGRVTSSSALAASDVTLALGYTPANSATTVSSQWTTSGSVIFYNSGSVGIGTTSPDVKLAVNSGAMRTYYSKDTYPSIYGEFVHNGDAGGLEISARGSTGGGSGKIRFLTAEGVPVERMRIDSVGNIGIGTTTPTAKLHLVSGTASVAPLKFTSGTLLASPQSGTMEYDGFNFYLTDSTNARRTIATGSSAGTIDNASTINSSGNMSLVPNSSVIVSSTTASINSATGALVVKGGLGVAGNIFSSGTIITSSNVQGASITATSGMISPYIYGSTTSGGALTLDSTTHASKGNILLAPIGGKVGIGTNNPGTNLDVAGNIRLSAAGPEIELNAGGPRLRVPAGNNLAFHTGGGFGSTANERMRIDSLGNVGIGTTNPSANLEVRTSTIDVSTTVLRLNSSDGAFVANQELQMDFAQNTLPTARIAMTYFNPDWGLNFYGYSSTLNQTPNLTIRGNGNIGVGTSNPAYLLDVSGTARIGDSIKNILIGNDSVGAYFEGRGSTSATNQIRLQSSSAFGSYQGILIGDSSVNGGKGIQFYTGGAFNNRMVITDTGNIGIGTSAPTALLDVSKTGTSDPIAKFGSPNATDSIALSIGHGTSFSSLAVAGGANAFTPGSSIDDLIIRYPSGKKALFSNGGLRTDVVIDSVGNVGIGTTSPSQRLEVSGSAKVSGNLFGAIKDTVGNSLKMCTGKSASSGWVYYSINSAVTGSCGAYLDIDTSSCGFTTVFKYFTSLGGVGSHWVTTGANSIYGPTATTFRIYINTVGGGFDASNCNATTLPHNTNAWFIDWMGVGM